MTLTKISKARRMMTMKRKNKATVCQPEDKAVEGSEKKRRSHKLRLEKKNCQCQAVDGAFKVQMARKHRMYEYEVRSLLLQTPLQQFVSGQKQSFTAGWEKEATNGKRRSINSFSATLLPPLSSSSFHGPRDTDELQLHTGAPKQPPAQFTSLWYRPGTWVQNEHSPRAKRR